MSTDLNLKVFVAVNVIFTEQHSVVELKKGSVFQVLGVHAELDKQRLIVNRLVSFISLHILGVFMCILNLLNWLINFYIGFKYIWNAKPSAKRIMNSLIYSSSLAAKWHAWFNRLYCIQNNCVTYYLCVFMFIHANTFPHWLQSDTHEQ